MPNQVVDLANLVTSSGGTNSSAVGGLDDADSITIVLNSTTTSGANTATVQIEVTATGTNFVSSTAYPGTATSSQALNIENVSFRQIRMVATGAMLNGLTFNVAKQIWV